MTAYVLHHGMHGICQYVTGEAHKIPLKFCCLDLGHVLVCSRRVVQRFTSLQPEEVADMWCAAKPTLQVALVPLHASRFLLVLLQ